CPDVSPARHHATTPASRVRLDYDPGPHHGAGSRSTAPMIEANPVRSIRDIRVTTRQHVRQSGTAASTSGVDSKQHTTEQVHPSVDGRQWQQIPWNPRRLNPNRAAGAARRAAAPPAGAGWAVAWAR